MNKRRDFLKIVSAGSVGSVMGVVLGNVPSSSSAADCCSKADPVAKLPENILFTEERPGVWAGKAGGHVPSVETEKTDDGLKLTVQTEHGMSPEHYIVRHTVVNGLGEVLGAKTFSWEDEPISEFEIELPEKCPAKDLYILSYCNKHDLWLLRTRLEG